MNKCLEIKSDWNTPSFKYPVVKKGRVQIKRIKQEGGYYHMEGVKGYMFYYHSKKIPVTCMIIDGETVMVDDPLHWIGMQELAKNCKGKVLIAGLGLGLILHALVVNKEVTEIHVVEIDEDVIDVMRDNIPKDDRIKIINENFVEYIDERCEICGSYDTVVMDIWWYGEDDSYENKVNVGVQMKVLEMKVRIFMPEAKVMIWGLKDTEINPAVTKIYNYNEIGKMEI